MRDGTLPQPVVMIPYQVRRRRTWLSEVTTSLPWGEFFLLGLLMTAISVLG